MVYDCAPFGSMSECETIRVSCGARNATGGPAGTGFADAAAALQSARASATREAVSAAMARDEVVMRSRKSLVCNGSVTPAKRPSLRAQMEPHPIQPDVGGLRRMTTVSIQSEGVHPVGGSQKLSVRGARVHNLKNVDLEIPRDSLVVFTGLSGSGKSSLAFDTIFAEGQRRYVESLSAYARQFL